MEKALIITSSSSSPRIMSHSSSSNSRQRRKMALADALAGVVASIISLWVFYPVEVIKTKIQAVPSSSNSTVLSSSSSSTALQENKGKHKQTQTQSSLKLTQKMNHLLQTLTVGWKWKTLHTASSSFCYFFLYSWIISLYTSSNSLRKGQDNTRSNTKPYISSVARLILSATAAILNTCLTLPLDVVAARQQNETVQQQQQQQESENNDTTTTAKLWRIQEEENDDDLNSLNGNSEDQEDENEEDDFCREEKKEDIMFECKNDKHNTVATTISRRHSSEESSNNLFYILSLWKGLGPSLLLCTNPAIHYTCYDTIKSRILLHRRQCNNNNNNNSTNKDNTNNNLTMREAFFLGILAKFVATIVTYPLIRTKVMLMVAAVTTSSSTTRRGRRTTTTSMLQCLKDEYKANGVRGLYQGCNLQLLHTLLKSALLMMIRERLTRTTTRLILGTSHSYSTNNTATTSAKKIAVNNPG